MNQKQSVEGFPGQGIGEDGQERRQSCARGQHPEVALQWKAIECEKAMVLEFHPDGVTRLERAQARCECTVGYDDGVVLQVFVVGA